MMDLFTERPVNRAITTTSPSATACQRSHPSGIKSCVVSFLIPFLLSVSPRVISVHRDISHADSFSCQMDLWAPCNCLLLLRFSKNERKQNFSILVSLNLEAKDIFSAVSRDGLKRILLGITRYCVKNVKACWM